MENVPKDLKRKAINHLQGLAYTYQITSLSEKIFGFLCGEKNNTRHFLLLQWCPNTLHYGQICDLFNMTDDCNDICDVKTSLKLKTEKSYKSFRRLKQKQWSISFSNFYTSKSHMDC